MQSIQDKLQALVDIKNEIKATLVSRKKEPTEKFDTYADLIGDLENPEDITYFVSLEDGSNKNYATLLGDQKVTLTAGPNDIRSGSVAINENGVIEGEKVIPVYYARYGQKALTANSAVTISIPEKDFKEIMITIAPFNTSLNASVAVDHVSVEKEMYAVNSTTKLSDISMDSNTIKLGITVNAMSVLRYFIMREEV